MEYALPVWYKPVSSNEDARRTGTVWVAKALGKVQRHATRLSNHGRTTHDGDRHTRLPREPPPRTHPIEQVRIQRRNTPRLPPSNPIHHLVRRCRYVPRFHLSPIHHLRAFPILRRTFETIDPLSLRAPAELTAHVAGSKDAAEKDTERVLKRGGFCVFTDGSGYEGGTGAAAVAMRNGVVGEHRLGPLTEHTVFESEVTGAILALDIICSTPRLTDVDVFMDYQPAISALSSTPKAQPGQHLIAAFYASHRRLLRARPTLRVRLHWVPAHVGIAGNEAVDARAEEAALGTSTALTRRVKTLEALPVSKAAAIAGGISSFKERWESEWNSSPRRLRLSVPGDTTPSTAISRMYDDLGRPQCSVLTQLRTGRAQRLLASLQPRALPIVLTLRLT